MELLYQYLWKQRMMGRKCLTVRGDDVEIIYAGIHNRDAGPDFLNARLRINDREWIGNVEIHVKASDWRRHGHDADPAYGNVILHVVGVDDMRVSRGDGSEIPQTVVTFPESFYRMYEALSHRISNVPCEPYIRQLPGLSVADWLSSLCVERMQDKADRSATVRWAATGTPPASYRWHVPSASTSTATPSRCWHARCRSISWRAIPTTCCRSRH